MVGDHSLTKGSASIGLLQAAVRNLRSYSEGDRTASGKYSRTEQLVHNGGRGWTQKDLNPKICSSWLKAETPSEQGNKRFKREGASGQKLQGLGSKD